jgi:hypothetical protein
VHGPVAYLTDTPDGIQTLRALMPDGSIITVADEATRGNYIEGPVYVVGDGYDYAAVWMEVSAQDDWPYYGTVWAMDLTSGGGTRQVANSVVALAVDDTEIAFATQVKGSSTVEIKVVPAPTGLEKSHVQMRPVDLVVPVTGDETIPLLGVTGSTLAWNIENPDPAGGDPGTGDVVQAFDRSSGTLSSVDGTYQAPAQGGDRPLTPRVTRVDWLSVADTTVVFGATSGDDVNRVYLLRPATGSTSGPGTSSPAAGPDLVAVPVGAMSNGGAAGNRAAWMATDSTPALGISVALVGATLWPSR